MTRTGVTTRKPSVLTRKILRRILLTSVGVSLLAGGIVLPADPAAASVLQSAWSTSRAYTDSRAPDEMFVDTPGDVPVGSWRDAEGKHHKSRAYYTFDLTPFHGARILSVSGWFNEKSVNNCEVDAAIEVWLTDPVDTATGWREPPAERALLDRIGPHFYGWCPAGYRRFQVEEAVRDAVAADRNAITIGFRVPEDLEGDVNQGRWFGNRAFLSVKYNNPPRLPTRLQILHSGDCVPQAPGAYIHRTEPELSAVFSDPDGMKSLQRVTATFAVWPVDQPDQRTEMSRTFSVIDREETKSVTVPAGVLSHGQTYAWAVRAADDADASEWTDPCYFTVDLVRPLPPTSVSSQQYPSGQWSGAPGITGIFRVTADSRDTDVTRFAYRINGGYLQYADADPSGQAGSIEFTPTQPGPHRMNVYTVDRAGNLSSSSIEYEFGVLENRPEIYVHTYPIEPGTPFQVSFRPGMDNVVSYTYRVDDGPQTTVPAGEDGTATITLRFEEPGLTHQLFVRSTDSSGYTTMDQYDQLHVIDNLPWVSFYTHPQPGVPVEATLFPNRDGVVSYTYRVDDGPETTVPAGEDGTATVSVTFDEPGSHVLYVRSTHSDGYVTQNRYEAVYVY